MEHITDNIFLLLQFILVQETTLISFWVWQIFWSYQKAGSHYSFCFSLLKLLQETGITGDSTCCCECGIDCKRITDLINSPFSKPSNHRVVTVKPSHISRSQKQTHYPKQRNISEGISEAKQLAGATTSSFSLLTCIPSWPLRSFLSPQITIPGAAQSKKLHLSSRCNLLPLLWLLTLAIGKLHGLWQEVAERLRADAAGLLWHLAGSVNSSKLPKMKWRQSQATYWWQ